MAFLARKIYFLMPLLVILVVIVIFFWPNLVWPAVNITPQVGTNDLTDLHYPFQHFLIESLRRGEWPLWSSAISSGYPILAAGQIGALYPLNILSAILPLTSSVNFVILSTYFLIGFFTYLYLGEIKLSRWSAVFGAVVSMFGGFSLSQLLHWEMLTALAFLMGELLILEKMVKSRKALYFLILGLFLGLSFLGGHPQTVFYSLIFLASYWLFLMLTARPKIIRNFLFLVLSLLLGLGIGAGQILPQYEFTQNSYRAQGMTEEAITRFNFPIRDLPTFIFPYLRYDPSQTLQAFQNNGWPQDERYTYLGILSLILAFLAVLTLFQKKARVVFFAGAAVFFLLLSFGGETPLGGILVKPPFNFFRLPLRFLMLVDLSLVILAAYGFEEVLGWVRAVGKRKMWVTGMAAGLILVTFADLWFQGSKLHPVVSAKDWYRQPETAKFLKEKLQNQERVITEYYYFPSAKIFMTQRHLWDEPQALINLRNLLPVFNNLLDGIPMTVGSVNSGGLSLNRYTELETELFFGGVKYASSGKPTLADGYLFISRLSGVRYVLISQELSGGLGLSKVFQTDFKNGQDNIYVYEFFDYYPRTFMVGQAQKETPEKIREHLLKVDFDPKQTIWVEEDTSWGAKGAMAASTQFVSYEDQEVTIKVQSSSDGFLFLSDAYYPGWKAYVDGKEKKIYLANYAFRAVEVPRGEHEVVFKYEPRSFWWGIRISLGTGGAVILGILALGLREIWKRLRTVSLRGSVS